MPRQILDGPLAFEMMVNPLADEKWDLQHSTDPSWLLQLHCWLSYNWTKFPAKPEHDFLFPRLLRLSLGLQRSNVISDAFLRLMISPSGKERKCQPWICPKILHIIFGQSRDSSKRYVRAHHATMSTLSCKRCPRARHATTNTHSSKRYPRAHHATVSALLHLWRKYDVSTSHECGC